MRTALHITLVLLCSIISIHAQQTRILWQKTIGGIGDDKINALLSDDAGQTYVLSTVQEDDNHQIHVSKITAAGVFLWTTIIDGERDERGADLLLSASGDLIVLGTTHSAELLSVSTKGYSDIVVARLSTAGELLQLNTFGGSFFDFPSSILQKPNGNFVITGTTSSSDGDVPTISGQLDIWMFEINDGGTILWSEVLGGQDEEQAVKTKLLDNGDLIVLGMTATYQGDFGHNHGDLDIVTFHTSGTGIIQSIHLYGGYLADYASDIEVLPNGNFLIAGNTFSNDGDVASNAGNSDAWLFEAAPNGSIEWSRTYGSYGNEYIVAIEPTEDGFLLLGSSNSTSINNISSNGSRDFWLYQIDGVGEVTDEYLFGASGIDEGGALVLNADGSILMGGRTDSSDGVVQGNSGQNDGWLLKIDRSKLEDVSQATVHPNPTEGSVYINNLQDGAQISVFNMNGVLVEESTSASVSSKVLDFSTYPSGMYLVHIGYTDRKEIHRVVKH